MKLAENRVYQFLVQRNSQQPRARVLKLEYLTPFSPVLTIPLIPTSRSRIAVVAATVNQQPRHFEDAVSFLLVCGSKFAQVKMLERNDDGDRHKADHDDQRIRRALDD